MVCEWKININNLPKELLIEIFCLLKPKDLFQVCFVCKEWFQLALDKKVKEEIFIKYFQFEEETKGPQLKILKNKKSVIFYSDYHCWNSIRTTFGFKPNTGLYFWEIYINNSSSGGNSWGVIIGVRINEIDFPNQSWGYIAGNGKQMKCYDAQLVAPASSQYYGEPYASGDTIGVLLDTNKSKIGFFKNNKFQGFFSPEYTFPKNLKVYPTIFLTHKKAQVTLLPQKLNINNWPIYVQKILNKYK